MTSILIETDTNSGPISAPVAPPMMTANVSQPGTAGLDDRRAARDARSRPRARTSPRRDRGGFVGGEAGSGPPGWPPRRGGGRRCRESNAAVTAERRLSRASGRAAFPAVGPASSTGAIGEPEGDPRRASVVLAHLHGRTADVAVAGPDERKAR